MIKATIRNGNAGFYFEDDLNGERKAEAIVQDLVESFWFDGSNCIYYDELDPYFKNDSWFKNQFLNYYARNSEKAIEQYY